MNSTVHESEGLHILFVDDEQSVLDGVQRTLRKEYRIDVACGGEQGLALIREKGPFAVVVSDMRMPVMNGAEFLGLVKDMTPDTIRIMLTGFAEVDAAIAAVNKGNIFRFMTKPVTAEDLKQVLEAAIAQYRLIRAEKELLEKTLKGSIQVLVDILSLTNPTAFSRATRLQHVTAQVVNRLSLADGWRIEVAAMLSQLGCVTVPEEILEKYYTGEALSDEEAPMIASLPDIARKLICDIPRLAPVSEIILYAGDAKGDLPACLDDDPMTTGAGILRAVMDFDNAYIQGRPLSWILGTMADRRGCYDKRVIEALGHVEVPEMTAAERVVNVEDLRMGMVLAEDMRAVNGMLVAAKGQEINDTIRRRLMNFATRGDVQKAVRVLMSRQVNVAKG
ncbi:MAG: response regulator [Spartobacteria bacterium]|nr:response regulator [Spartobacteria bacterium]